MYIAHCYVRFNNIISPYTILPDHHRHQGSSGDERPGFSCRSVVCCSCFRYYYCHCRGPCFSETTCLFAGQRQTGKKPSKGKLLSPPVPRKCSESEKDLTHFNLFLQWSPVTGPKRFKYQGHNYFYSGDVAPYKKIKYDWLDGRNFCR